MISLSFVKNLFMVVTGLLGTTRGTAFFGTPTFWLMAGKFAWDLWSGYKKAEGEQAAGEAGREAYYANAQDLLRYSGINAGIIQGAAARNAAAYLTIGEANAHAIERAANRNLFLYGIQANEEVRRHVWGEKMVAGEIRAMVGAAGVQTNTGTPLHYLNTQVSEAFRQRKYMVTKHEATMYKIAAEAQDAAFVTRLTASENAAVIMSNAEAQSRISILDAQRQAAAMQRQGDLAQLIGSNNAQASMISGIGNAINTIGIGYSNGAFDWMSSNPTSNLAANWKMTGFGWSNKETFNPGFMNPYPQYGDSLPTPSLGGNTGFNNPSILNPYPSWS